MAKKAKSKTATTPKPKKPRGREHPRVVTHGRVPLEWGSGSRVAIGHHLDDAGRSVRVATMELPRDMAEATAERLTDSYNACIEMENPAACIQQMQAHLREAAEYTMLAPDLKAAIRKLLFETKADTPKEIP